MGQIEQYEKLIATEHAKAAQGKPHANVTELERFVAEARSNQAGVADPFDLNPDLSKRRRIKPRGPKYDGPKNVFEVRIPPKKEKK